LSPPTCGHGVAYSLRIALDRHVLSNYDTSHREQGQRKNDAEEPNETPTTFGAPDAHEVTH
jgi:hypothetical protein